MKTCKTLKLLIYYHYDLFYYTQRNNIIINNYNNKSNNTHTRSLTLQLLINSWVFVKNIVVMSGVQASLRNSTCDIIGLLVLLWTLAWATAVSPLMLGHVNSELSPSLSGRGWVISDAGCDYPHKDTASIKCSGATAWSTRVKQSNVYLMHYNEIRRNNITHLGCLACVETAVLPDKHHRGLTLTSADQTRND